MARDRDAEIEAQIPGLRRYAFALVRDRDRADDLVQDCLERALSRWRVPMEEEDLRRWLFTILRNLFLSSCRDERRRGAPAPLDEQGGLGVPAEQERGLVARDALGALSQLPEEQQSLLLLIAVEDLSYDTAARVLGVPIGTVMSRLSRARRSLRALMERENPPLLRRVK